MKQYMKTDTTTGRTKKSIFVVRDINSPLSVSERTSRQSIRCQGLNNSINQQDLVYNY